MTDSVANRPQRRGGALEHNAYDPSDDDEQYVSSSKVIANVQKIVSSLPVDHFGTTVYVKGWRPEPAPTVHQPPILIVHDLGEHAGLYRETALTFVEHGFAAYGFDLRGHGRSGRRLGHAASFNVLVKDLLQVAAWVRRNEGGEAPIILGQGIGALIALEFIKNFAVFCRAAILSAPVLELSVKVSWFTKTFLKIMADVSPTMRLPKSMNPRFAKDLHNAANAEASAKRQSAADVSRNMFFPRLTSIFANELLQATVRAKISFQDYPGHVLILCPLQDTICTYERLKKSAVMDGSIKVQISDVNNSHHVFTDDEQGRQNAINVILPWLKQTLNLESIGPHD